MSDSLVTPWAVAPQAPLSVGFSRDWSAWTFPFPRDLPDSGIKLGSPALQADSTPSEPPGKNNDQALRTQRYNINTVEIV